MFNFEASMLGPGLNDRSPQPTTRLAQLLHLEKRVAHSCMRSTGGGIQGASRTRQEGHAVSGEAALAQLFGVEAAQVDP